MSVIVRIWLLGVLEGVTLVITRMPGTKGLRYVLACLTE